jgi:hypothetical protein
MERHPGVGWPVAATSFTGGIWAMLEAATKIAGFVGAIIGVAVGIYTLLIQRRTWKKGAENTSTAQPNDNQDGAS